MITRSSLSIHHDVDSAQTFDVVVVGSGPTGALVASRAAEQGLSVVVLEAGQRFNGITALQNTEANAGKIMWAEPRNFVGADFVIPKAGMGLGGGTLPWLGVMPRFAREDFHAHSLEGVGADWPIGYDDLRPHYEKVEWEFGLSGECGPYAPEQYALPMPPHRMNWHAQVLARGARKLGAHPFAPPIAINSQERDGRPACIYCGWCGSGCPTEAKATSANTYLARAGKLGARVITGAMVHRVNYDATTGRATGIEYLDSLRREHRINAGVVVLAAHAIETPRLLLMSANNIFPDGLANSSGMVGRNFMSHPTWQVFGTFDDPINAHKGMQMGHVMVQDFNQSDPRNDYARGFILLSYMMTPVTFGNLSGLMFGQELKDFLHEYSHTAAWWAHAEGLPHENNTITLDPELRDSHGLPAARVTYQWGANDLKVATAARQKAAEFMSASGARKVRIGLNYGAHAMGSCRMGADPKSSVVNGFGQSHDIENLFICDTSVFVTGSGVNPTLTAMAIANRTAEYLIAGAGRGDL
jgi:choline dehydrogenase-like flavoprotein